MRHRFVKLSLSAVCGALALALAAAISTGRAASWRSSLYPADWTPPHDRGGLDFTRDNFLQDFSYAGYRQNTAPLPAPTGPVFDVVSDFGADATGTADATAAIQSAIDAATAAGGGVVMLPAGTYRVSRPAGATTCLEVAASGVVLRGAGSDRTMLVNTTTAMRGARVVRFQPPGGGSWNTPATTPVALTRDEPGPTRRIQIATTAGLAVGDLIVAHNPATAAFVNELRMGPGSDGVDWTSSLAQVRGPRSVFRITAIDPATRELTLDAPTRWALRLRDQAVIYRLASPLTDVGLEQLAVGNLAHPGDGWAEEDYIDPARAAHAVHDSFLIELRGVIDGWVRDVRSHNPGNANGAHFLSNGVLLSYCRNVTLRGVVLARAQYGGGGGNGYGIRLNSAQDCLVLECTTAWLRHGLVMWHIDNAGNVITASRDEDTGWQQGNGPATPTSGRGSDHHGVFSHSNLIDANTVTRSYFEAAYRGDWGGDPDHGITSSQTVFWNTTGAAYRSGNNYIVHSQQFGPGYIIGTQGAATAVQLGEKRPGSASRTDPVDFSEGIGEGATLAPQSLFRDQLARRLGAGADWLLVPLTIVEQPLSLTVPPGGAAAFRVTVEGANDPAPTYQWFKDNQPLPGATAATLALTGLTAADRGTYHVVVTAGSASIASLPATLTVDVPRPGSLANESVLTDLLPARGLTVGFTLSQAPRTVLVRGMGPSLDPFLDDPVLTDPELTLHRLSDPGPGAVATNAAWQHDPVIAASAAMVGAFPFDSGEDTALLRTLAPGNYTAVLEAGPGSTGKALVEVYTLPADVGGDTGRLVNLSALRRLDTDTASLTAGFVIEGNVPRSILLRAVGPSLEPYVGGGFLADPIMTLHRLGDAAPITVLTVDDWQALGTWRQTRQVAAEVGAFALSERSADAAVVLTLVPGRYTLRVERKPPDAGLTLLEIYECP